MTGSIGKSVLLLLLANEIVHCLRDGYGDEPRQPRPVSYRNRQRKFDSPFKVRTAKGLPQREGTRYTCRIATTGVIGLRDGRLLRSRAVAYSTDAGAGVKTLICRAETTDVVARRGAFRRKSVAGLNVVTTGTGDPLPFIHSIDAFNSDDLIVGSKAASVLEATSAENRSVSAVDTRDAGAEALTRSRTEFQMSGGDGARTGMESEAEAESTADFGVTGKPVVLTGKEEEESSVTVGRTGVEDEATVIDHKKVTDFDIAFRHAFNV